MPYTENTRIKVEKHRRTSYYTAQVEYVWPIVGFKEWVNFDDACEAFSEMLFGESTPTKACRKAWKKHPDLTGEPWAKAIIDEYHEVLKDNAHNNTTEYVKYP